MPACSRTLTAPPCRCATPTSAGAAASLGARAVSAKLRKHFRGRLEDQLRQQRGEVRLEPGLAREALGFVLEPLGDPAGGVLEGLVLQQAGEEQVAGLEQRHVFVVVVLVAGQQARGLQVQQRRGDDEELGGLIQRLGAGPWCAGP